MAIDNTEAADALKQQAWKALSDGTPHPDLSAMLERGVNPLEVQYLLERWATLTIYDAFNLEAPGLKQPITLHGASEHFVVYDRGTCLVAGPKDLFSHAWTLADGIKTMAAMAREVYQRHWTVELVGYEKYRRAAWVELQVQSQQHGHSVDVLNFTPSVQDYRIVRDKMMHQNDALRPE